MALSKIKTGSLAADAVTSAAIADGAIVIADLADGSITSPKLATQTGNVTFADNARVILGDGNDLQIFHNGSDSYIKDAGTGDLYLQGSNNVQIESAAGANMIYATAGAQVRLFYDGSPKFNTTATGIDVTGIVTADGLSNIGSVTLRNTVGSADVTIGATTNSGTIGQEIGRIQFENGSGQQSGAIFWERASGGNNYGDVGLVASAGGSRTNQLRLETNGDISFYEDTGTTAKFFWDASTERLGIGTTSPVRELQVGDNTGANEVISIQSSSSGKGSIMFGDNTTTSAEYAGMLRYDHANNSMQFWGASTERMRINSSGNVGIGTSSPDQTLHVHRGSAGSVASQANSVLTLENSTTAVLQFLTPAASSAQIRFGDPSDNGAGYIDYGHSSNVLSFGVNGPEKMRISSSGNVSIGSSTDAGNKLFVNGVLSTGLGGQENTPQEALRLLRSGYPTSYYHSIFMSSGSGSRSQHYIDFMMNNATGSGQELACRIRGDKAFIVYGTLSKSSGSFRIDHPLESKSQTHELVHSFVEAPQADNIYRGKVDLVAGSAIVNIDTVAGMTEGTFVALNREIQCFTSNESGWTAVRGSVSGNILTIEAQDNTCTDTISWLVVGERHDQHMYDTGWTDENGKVIVEPEKH